MVKILVAYFLRGHFTTATITAMVLLKAQAVTVVVSLASQVIVTKCFQVNLRFLLRVHVRPRIGFIRVVAFGILKYMLIIFVFVLILIIVVDLPVDLLTSSYKYHFDKNTKQQNPTT